MTASTTASTLSPFWYRINIRMAIPSTSMSRLSSEGLAHVPISLVMDRKYCMAQLEPLPEPAALAVDTKRDLVESGAVERVPHAGIGGRGNVAVGVDAELVVHVRAVGILARPYHLEPVAVGERQFHLESRRQIEEGTQLCGVTACRRCRPTGPRGTSR